jgi:hypothetical protein
MIMTPSRMAIPTVRQTGRQTGSPGGEDFSCRVVNAGEFPSIAAAGGGQPPVLGGIRSLP